MSHSHDSEPEFEKLSKAITEAVMSSGKVRKIVEEIQKKDEICPQSFMVLVLKMQVLTESLEFKVEQNNREGKPITKKRNRKNVCFFCPSLILFYLYLTPNINAFIYFYNIS